MILTEHIKENLEPRFCYRTIYENEQLKSFCRSFCKICEQLCKELINITTFACIMKLTIILNKSRSNITSQHNIISQFNINRIV